ncbi:MAG TPA: tetratricopeptide repeat protein [Abditibacterium sp.]
MTAPQKPLANDLDALKRAETAAGHVMAARNAARKGEKERAKVLLKDAFAASPGDLAGLELLGDIYLEDGETEQALQLFERALKVHPHHAPFEEKLAMCRLDLAEIEADKLARQMRLTDGFEGKIFERSPGKAIGLSLVLPGAGQFYNEENELGIAYLAAGLISFFAWVYPFREALARWPKSQIFSLGGLIGSMNGMESMMFYVGSAIYTLVYLASIVAAGKSAQRYAEERRISLGL